MEMRQVYSLAAELEGDPERVARTQALTRNPDKPLRGLKGNHGLFGSAEWWANIRAGIMPTERLSGVIRRVYVAGQDPSDAPNSFDLVTDGGTTRSESIYVNSPDDVARFKPGSRVDILYALDEMKAPAADGSKDYSSIVLEMSVSV